jgi:hypothetical protein
LTGDVGARIDQTSAGVRYFIHRDILALEGDDFRRAITLPVEDMLHMVWPPDLEREYRAGVFRWFRSENVVDLLKIHRTRQEAVGQIRRLLPGRRGTVVAFPRSRTYAGRPGHPFKPPAA